MPVALAAPEEPAEAAIPPVWLLLLPEPLAALLVPEFELLDSGAEEVVLEEFPWLRDAVSDVRSIEPVDPRIAVEVALETAPVMLANSRSMLV